MRDLPLESLIERRKTSEVAFDLLMPHRVHNILLVSSLYDSFTLREDGELSESLFSEYLSLNLRHPPRIIRVSSAKEALARIAVESFDLVITMLRVGGMALVDFRRQVHERAPHLPVLLLAYNNRELEKLQSYPFTGLDKPFVWLGDVQLFLAMLKYVEDRLNVTHDTRLAGVQSIILIEDSVRFYSAFLPLLYTELMKQTQAVMAEGLTWNQRLLRMTARPKVLLATSYEEGLELYHQHRENVLGVITDAAYPSQGQLDPQAGLRFARMVKADNPDRAVLVLSSDDANEALAHQAGASFINKRNPALLGAVREFILANFGFGDFTFSMPDGTVVATAHDLKSFIECLKTVPAESLLHHARRNHYSTWLMARTEFPLAKALRPRKVTDFATAEDIRHHLIESVTAQRRQSQAGVVAEFSSVTFDAHHSFVRFGAGSMGGKGRGLAFVHSLFGHYEIQETLPGVRIEIPPTLILGTDVFDRFMEQSGLRGLALSEAPDPVISRAFLEAKLPDELREVLTTLLKFVHYPLAVRSSSLLEDAYYQPFAGVYHTYMLPNNHPDPDIRFQELTNAIKLVYASSYLADAKAYVASTSWRVEEEKMAIVIQRIAGRVHEHYLYPDVAGVARSVDFYPMAGMQAEDGVASVALGLGRMVVEGGRCLRFSPGHPRRLYQFSTTRDTLANSQREFFALDLSAPGPREEIDPDRASNIVPLGLDVAQRHGTLTAVGSVYSPEDDRIHDGLHQDGIKLVTMAGVLKGRHFPLAQALRSILHVAHAGLNCPAEIEFAVSLRKGTAEQPHLFSFLQIRPIVMGVQAHEFALQDIADHDIICRSSQALGHGRLEGIRDLVYIDPRTFDRSRALDAAGQVGKINQELRAAGRNFILIGPGRWGTNDHWLGIPVSWSQIDAARCIVETDMEDIRVTPSQGTHFFQNITSFGIPYFTVNTDDQDSRLDLDWLQSRNAATALDLVRHVAFDEPVDVLVNGRQQKGVILKPGKRAAIRQGGR
ncbi:MAG: hypothetical protein JW797_19760 [Bradymonadales bacterium]|nr:hypothetical protein [Bradymonadales bacterium]